MDKEIAATLNREGFVGARGCLFQGENVWLLRKPWGLPTVKINGTEANPTRWPDGATRYKATRRRSRLRHRRFSSISSEAS